MSDERIQFEEEPSYRTKQPAWSNTAPKGMTGFLIRRGVAGNENEAGIVLLIFFVILVAAGWILYKVISPSPAPRVSQQQIDQAMERYIHPPSQ